MKPQLQGNQVHGITFSNPSSVTADMIELFQRKFGDPPPADPEHFVVRAGELLLGYVHYQPYQDVYLGGGLCVDTAALRQLSPEQRHWLRTQGSVAELLMRGVELMLRNRTTALFGYVGDPRATLVDLRAGYSFTEYPRLIVLWCKPLDAEARRIREGAVAALGPF